MQPSGTGETSKFADLTFPSEHAFLGVLLLPSPLHNSQKNTKALSRMWRELQLVGDWGEAPTPHLELPALSFEATA